MDTLIDQLHMVTMVVCSVFNFRRRCELTARKQMQDVPFDPMITREQTITEMDLTGEVPLATNKIKTRTFPLTCLSCTWAHKLQFELYSGMDPPESLNYQVTLRYFTDYIRQSQTSLADNKDSLNDAWKRYCNQFMRKGFLRFFDEMRREAWFRERYEPSQEMEDLRIMVKKAGRDGKMQKFMDEATSGSLKDIFLEVGGELRCFVCIDFGLTRPDSSCTRSHCA